jgi:hypothetical protein
MVGCRGYLVAIVVVLEVGSLSRVLKSVVFDLIECRFARNVLVAC